MAQFYGFKLDKDAVRADTIPNLRSGQRSKPDLIQVGLHIQQQSAAGHIVHLQDVILQRTHCCNITSAQLSLLLSVRNPRLAEKIHRTTVVYRGFLLKDSNQRLGFLRYQLQQPFALGAGVPCNL